MKRCQWRDRGMSHQLGFLQRLKASFTFCAMKHSGDFCFTSVIAYNSMKLQPEPVSLAADKQSCECGTWGGREGGWQPLVSHISGLSQREGNGDPSGDAAGFGDGCDRVWAEEIGQRAQIGNKHMGPLSRASSASHLGAPVLSALGASSSAALCKLCPQPCPTAP